MGTWCTCDLNFNTFSLWDPLTLWTCWKWTTNLSSVPPIISSATASVSAYNFWTLCSSVWYIHVVIEGVLKEIIFRDLCVENAVARSTHTQITLEIDFERTWLPNTSWRVCKTTFSVFRLPPSCCKNVLCTCLPHRMTGMTLRALAAIFTGFLECCPNDQSSNSLLADLHHTVCLQAVGTLLLRFLCG